MVGVVLTITIGCRSSAAAVIVVIVQTERLQSFRRRGMMLTRQDVSIGRQQPKSGGKFNSKISYVGTSIYLKELARIPLPTIIILCEMLPLSPHHIHDHVGHRIFRPASSIHAIASLSIIVAIACTTDQPKSEGGELSDRSKFP